LIRSIGYIVSYTFPIGQKLFSNLAISGVGPATGAIAAVLFYNFIKILEYEMANPGQDEASPEDAAAVAHEVQEVQRAKVTGTNAV